jgi:hypothetical protein
VQPFDYTCFFYTDGDPVHYSATPGDVSGHGWWINEDCPAGTKAKVTVKLQEWYDDGTWHTKNTGSKTVYAGGGSANRATARATCAQSVGDYYWRTVVDVDLVGITDSANVYITPYQPLTCVVY